MVPLRFCSSDESTHNETFKDPLMDEMSSDVDDFEDFKSSSDLEHQAVPSILKKNEEFDGDFFKKVKSNSSKTPN